VIPQVDRDDDRAAVATEASVVQIALAGALDAAGVRLPQLAVKRDERDYLIRLGACNVKVGIALHGLIRDALTLRARYPEESIDASA